MSRSDVLHVATAAAWIIVFVFLRAERRLLRTLRRHDATDPTTAIDVSSRSPFVRLRLRRLLSAGALVETAPGRYYLDSSGFSAYRRRRQRRALVIIAAMLALAFLVFGVTR